MRWRQPELARPFRTWLYPLTPIIFLIITGWTLLYVVLQRPIEAMITLSIVGSGAVFYFVSQRLGARLESDVPARGESTQSSS